MIPIVPPKTNQSTEKLYKANGSKLKEIVEQKVDAWADKNLQIGKWALIAGAAAFGGYVLIDFFTEKKKRKKIVIEGPSKALSNKKPNKDSWVINSIKGYILAFLLNIAKEKLVEALAKLNNDEQEKAGPTTA
jgi:hypothetical protein